MARPAGPARVCERAGCSRKHLARGLCSTHYNQEHQHNRHRKIVVHCDRCGRDYPKDESSAKRYKSNICEPCWIRPAVVREAERLAKEERSAARLPRGIAQRKLDEAREGTKGWGVLVAGICGRPNCGEYFIRRYAGAAAPSPFCSSTCRRTERQRQRGINDEVRLAIFERDGWRCQIERCLLRSRTIDREAKIPAPASPTVDHILPQSAGGDDEPANLRAAHFICNSARRDRGTVQLALIG